MSPSVPTPADYLAAFQTTIPMVANPPDYASLHALRIALCDNASPVETSLGGGTHGHMGLVLTPTAYDAIAPGTPYVNPPNPGVTANIPNGATAAVIGALERAHTTSRYTYEVHTNLHEALKKAICQAVHPTYLKHLRRRYAGLTNTTVRQMFTHLFNTYAQMDHQAIMQNLQKLHEPWDPNMRLEDLGDFYEDAQDMAAETAQPITAANLVSAYYTQVYASGNYDDECKTWLAKPDADQTWPNIRAHFLKAQTELHRRRNRTTSNAGYHANAAAAEEATAPAADIQELLFATAQSHQALAARQQDDAHDLRAQILALQTQLATALQRPGAVPQQPQQPRRQRTIAPNNNYCWTHGWKVGSTHTSATCERRATGHQETATRANTMGGSNANKPTVPATAT